LSVFNFQTSDIRGETFILLDFRIKKAP